jgi:acyl-CoA synthetase (NDP forming)
VNNLKDFSNNDVLDLLFEPKNVLIYDAKPKVAFFVDGFIRQGYNLDNLYLVSTEVEELIGIKCLKSIDDVPVDSIDLVILSVRRDDLVKELSNLLSRKKISFIHIFTAGTGEFDEKGAQIEKEIKDILNSYPFTRSIGPNCMGLYCPKGKIAYYSSFPTENGDIGLIFQSGDLHSKMVKYSSRRYNLRFSKGVSVGNCVDIQISEFLRYLNDDNDTKVICVYFEGLPVLHKNEGKRLLEILKNMKKPVLFMRGGRTERGQAAVLTHTGSLASRDNIWKAIFKQTSIIDVPPSLDELIDYTYLFSTHLQNYKKRNKEVKYPKSKNVLVVLWSGGFGILATDILTDLGLDLPMISGKKLDALKQVYPIRVGSLANPLDVPWIVSSKVYLELCKAAIDDTIDLVLVVTDAWRDLDGDRFNNFYNNLLGIKKHVESLDKIFVIILPQYPSESRKMLSSKLKNDGFFVYKSIESAARSFLKLHEYGKKRKIALWQEN